MSGVSTNTCSCMSVVPRSVVSTGPRTVSTVVITPSLVAPHPARRVPSVHRGGRAWHKRRPPHYRRPLDTSPIAATAGETMTDTATTPSTDQVLEELHDWLSSQWDPELTVGAWWERLGLAGWSAPSL